jgi:hypothetical protein
MVEVAVCWEAPRNATSWPAIFLPSCAGRFLRMRYRAAKLTWMAKTQRTSIFSAQGMAGSVASGSRMAGMSAKRPRGAGPQMKSELMDVTTATSGGKGPGAGGKRTKATLAKIRRQNERRDRVRMHPTSRASRRLRPMRRVSWHPRWWLKPVVDVLLAVISLIYRWPWGR